MKTNRREVSPFFYPGDERGLLLIHGFTGSTAEMIPMGTFFHSKGMTVHGPLLAGHGTTPEEMAKTSWKDWWQSAVHGYERLKEAGCERIYVGGLSMGGLLALRLAREKKVQGAISMAAPIRFRDRTAHFAFFIHHFIPYVGRGPQKAPHIEEVIVPYEKMPVKSVAELKRLMQDVRRGLPKIRTPVLIVQGKRDETIFPTDAKIIYETIGSQQKEIHYYDNSSHILVLDHDREKIFQDVYEFIQKLEGME
ncbi:Lipase/esterase Est [[Clostridium] ultunense Esp]|nr:Lipase/esterase Est [[Clostridium] ultunense Esp]